MPNRSMADNDLAWGFGIGTSVKSVGSPSGLGFGVEGGILLFRGGGGGKKRFLKLHKALAADCNMPQSLNPKP